MANEIGKTGATQLWTTGLLPPPPPTSHELAAMSAEELRGLHATALNDPRIKKVDLERISDELEKKDPQFHAIRTVQRLIERSAKEKLAQAEHARREQAYQDSYLERQSAQKRWENDYDDRRYQATRKQDRDDFMSAMDHDSLANLEFLAHVGAVDSVGGYAPIAAKGGSKTEKLEGQIRLIEPAWKKRAKTDRLELANGAAIKLELLAMS